MTDSQVYKGAIIDNFLSHERLERMAQKGGSRSVGYWNNETKWPDGFIPPCPQSTLKEPCSSEQ
jgi:hypothetical protein